jgi:hypothetical protein
VENSYFFRVSHSFSSKDDVFVRYNIDVADITAPSGSLRDVKLTNTSPMNATIQYTVSLRARPYFRRPQIA